MNCHHSESPLPGVESQTVIYVSYYSFKGAAMYYLFYCGNEGSVVLYLTILLLIPFRLLKCHNVYNFFWNKFTIKYVWVVKEGMITRLSCFSQ